MTRIEEQRATLEAIAYGEDPRISPRDRMDAIDRLSKLPGHGVPGTDAMVRVAAEVAELSDAQLDAELKGFFDPGHEDPPPDPGEEQIKKEVNRRLRVRRERRRKKDEREQEKVQPQQVPAEPQRVAAQAAPASQPDRQRQAKVIRLDTGEVFDLAVPMSQAQRSIVASKLTRQQARDKIREQKRKRHPFGGHMPPGADAGAWDRGFS